MARKKSGGVAAMLDSGIAAAGRTFEAITAMTEGAVNRGKSAIGLGGSERARGAAKDRGTTAPKQKETASATSSRRRATPEVSRVLGKANATSGRAGAKAAPKRAAKKTTGRAKSAAGSRGGRKTAPRKGAAKKTAARKKTAGRGR